MVKNGDAEVIEILDNYCYQLALQLHNFQHIYDSEKIAIGGGISAQDILMEYIEKTRHETVYIIYLYNLKKSELFKVLKNLLKFIKINHIICVGGVYNEFDEKKT